MNPDIHFLDGKPVFTKEQEAQQAVAQLILEILVNENFTIEQVRDVLRSIERKIDDVKFVLPLRPGSYERNKE